MKNIKILFVPIMAMSFLLGCSKKRPNPPIPVVEGGGIDLTYMRVNVSAHSEIKFSCTNEAKDLKVYWGDGTVNNSMSHTFNAGNQYNIYITGNVDNISLTNDSGELLAKSNNHVSNIIFSNHVTNISANAFKIGNNAYLRSVFIPNTVNTIGTNAFDTKKVKFYFTEDKGWSSNWHIGPNNEEIPGTNLYMTENKILYATYEDAQSNGKSAYLYMCCDLQLKEAIIDSKITIDNNEYSVVGIWNSAFYDLDTLENVVIPSSIKSIDDYAFVNCKNLKTVTLNEGLKTIGYNVFQNTAIASITIPASVESIKSKAFADCQKLEKVEFVDGSNLEKLSSQLFTGSPNINKFKLAEGLKDIESYAFRDLSIKELALPSTLANLNDYIIDNCLLLESIDAAKFTSDNIIPQGQVTSNAFSLANPGNTIKIRIAAGLTESNFIAKNWPESCLPTSGKTGIEYIPAVI